MVIQPGLCLTWLKKPGRQVFYLHESFKICTQPVLLFFCTKILKSCVVWFISDKMSSDELTPRADMGRGSVESESRGADTR